MVGVKDQVRKICMDLPNVTEQVQWENHLLFKIGGKMFAITSLEPSPNLLSFKADPEEFAELIERPGFIPAPYLARAKWVAIETGTPVPRGELERLLKTSYDLVVARLPRKARPA